jgi:histidine ammonia-lyase
VGAGGPGPDRFVAPELEAVVAAVADGRLLAAARSVVGELN